MAKCNLDNSEKYQIFFFFNFSSTINLLTQSCSLSSLFSTNELYFSLSCLVVLHFIIEWSAE